MKKDHKILLGLALTCLALVFAMGYSGGAENLHRYRLILTSDGCAYVQSIGFAVKTGSGPCSAVAAFQPSAFSGGGMLYLNEDLAIRVSDSMLLATEKLNDELPLTSAQRNRQKWFYVWLCTAITILSTTMIYWKMK